MGKTSAGLDDAIMAEGIGPAPACRKFDERCHGCQGEQCSACNATVQFGCCMSKATGDADKKACCKAGKFPGASTTDACATDGATTSGSAPACRTFDESCHGEQCSACNATVQFGCCMSKATGDADRKACCN